MSEDLHATRRRSLDASAADRFWDVRARIERMLDPPGAYTSERARVMITIQAAGESTTIEKIAARNEKRSVRRLSVTTAATGAAISAYGSLGILRSLPARRTEMRPVVLSNMAAYDGPSCILANADLSASAQCRRATRSSSDIGGSRFLTTPLCPRTLGKDSVTPYSTLYEATGMTARSFRSTVSATRAHAIPIICWRCGRIASKAR